MIHGGFRHLRWSTTERWSASSRSRPDEGRPTTTARRAASDAEEGQTQRDASSVLPITAVPARDAVWIGYVRWRRPCADEFSLSGVEAGMVLAAASIAALVVALPLGFLADRFGARRVTIASACSHRRDARPGLAGDFCRPSARASDSALPSGRVGCGCVVASDSLPRSAAPRCVALATTVAGLGFTVGPGPSRAFWQIGSRTGTPFLALLLARGSVTAACCS